uniref:Protein disulfide-isomerase n=1 Tax=Rhabditophanes sp. KR3021 TaxID=114890 RepID=A0AC35UG00_9BILA
MLAKLIALTLLVASVSAGSYGTKGDVVELTEANFEQQVIKSDAVWIVKFYSPNCGHCVAMTEDFLKAAKALKGLAKVGAVDMTQHRSVGGPYNIQGFPTIKIFGANKKKPLDFNGQRTAASFVESCIKEVSATAKARLGGKSSGSSGNNGKSGGNNGKSEVVDLTESNFDELVYNSDSAWLVAYTAPWCGHCKQLHPNWVAASSQLKGKFKLGSVDATVHGALAQKFGVQGYPTIKYFPAGSMKSSDAQEYDGGRTANDIVSWASKKVAENLPAPEVVEVLDQEQTENKVCKDKQLCIIAVLPHILDCQSKCRNDYVAMLQKLADKYKKNIWGWAWTEAGKQYQMEEAFEIGGFGYPAMVAVNTRKQKFSMLKGSFAEDGISEFLRDLSYGRGNTQTLAGNKFPVIQKVAAWDGKDGEMPVEEEIDLSDVELDDIKTDL